MAIQATAVSLALLVIRVSVPAELAASQVPLLLVLLVIVDSLVSLELLAAAVLLAIQELALLELLANRERQHQELAAIQATAASLELLVIRVSALLEHPDNQAHLLLAQVAIQVILAFLVRVVTLA